MGVHILIERQMFPLIIIPSIALSPSLPLYLYASLFPLPPPFSFTQYFVLFLHFTVHIIHTCHPLSFRSYPPSFSSSLVSLISLHHFLSPDLFPFNPVLSPSPPLPSLNPSPKWSTADLSPVTSFAADATPPSLNVFVCFISADVLYFAPIPTNYYGQRSEMGKRGRDQGNRMAEGNK